MTAIDDVVMAQADLARTRRNKVTTQESVAAAPHNDPQLGANAITDAIAADDLAQLSLAQTVVDEAGEAYQAALAAV
jgi:hypothetical protein